ncbi:hypothetical protein HY628_02255 [Candidatus Uhrbacteria bacterium]|nr:hypothetical protein [Candidatus Uhrbacteria bacterium]
MAFFFLIVILLAFIGLIGWQNREADIGGSPNKPLTLGVFTAVIVVYLLIVWP